MKKTLLYCSILMTILVIGFYSCKPDDTNNNPEPVTDPRDKFVGVWTCHENSHIHGTSTYNVTISLDPSNSSYVKLSDFYMLGDTTIIQGLVTNSTITVNAQTTCSCTFNGSGTLSNSTTMNWHYTVTDIADIDTCTAVYNKH